MRKYAILLLVVLLAFAGCAGPPVLEVTLDTPANGGTVSSLTPILAWTSTGNPTSYRVQVASDGSFQNLIIDVTDLPGPSYGVPAGKLTNDQNYYWRVNASREGQTSDWATYWSFRTQTTTGTIVVNTTLNGAAWSGSVGYSITGPKASSGSSVSESFTNLPSGTYAATYNSGGPSGATLVNITSSATQTLSPGGSITFTLNFHTEPTDTIMVAATLDGVSWSGQVNYTVTGPALVTSSYIPESFTKLIDGTYTVTYASGGPAGATLVSISPSPSQALYSGGTIIFTLNFHSQAASAILVNATLDGASWSGQVSYTIHGPYPDASSYVPESFTNLPAGTYTLSYMSGGPAGATLVFISSGPTQYLSPGGTIYFTLNFQTAQPTGTIMVSATLDGSPWQTAIGSGTISYTIHGPTSDSSSTMPDTFGGMPAGSYTLSYMSGGPIGATLVNISPGPTQTLAPGGTIYFTLNFHSQATGIVMVEATLNGEAWSGSVTYTLVGPYVDSSSSVPQSFTNCPSGSYTLSYTSGGPPSSVLDSISPSPTQSLAPGGTLTFTLNFSFEGVLGD